MPTHRRLPFASHFGLPRLAFVTLGALLLCAAPPPVAAQVKVFANGDSITYGAGSSDGMTKAYAPILGGLLGSGYLVERDGVSGATLLKKGNPSFFNTQGILNTTRANPDIITILLGTNDSKPGNWVYRDEFVGDYLSLIDTYAGLPASPDIYPCLPPPAQELTGDIRGSVIANEVIPRILEAARQRNLSVIDLHTPFLDSLSTLFVDGIHPNDEGHRLIAARIRDAIISGRVLRPTPGLWTRTDVGSVGNMGGDAVDEAGNVLVWGGGSAIGGTTDAFRFVHQASSDHLEIVARVAPQRNTDPLVETEGGSAAGVMIREGTGAGARHVSVIATPGAGVSLRWRDAIGASGGATTVTGVKQPVWVKLRRVGSVYTGFYSSNGSDWRQIGQPRSVDLPNARIGIAANSALPDELTQARFEQVAVTQLSAGDPPPISFGDGRLRGARRAWAPAPGGSVFRADYLEDDR